MIDVLIAVHVTCRRSASEVDLHGFQNAAARLNLI